MKIQQKKGVFSGLGSAFAIMTFRTIFYFVWQSTLRLSVCEGAIDHKPKPKSKSNK